ncbi:MAG: LON peptidase substrate-binding domain-containing protein [Planctomycetota bacterium]
MSGSPDEIDVRVRFGAPMPLFPFDELVVLPQQIVPLHIFEARYRQMIERSLDNAGQIGLAVWRPGPGPEHERELRPTVCVTQIMHHERLPDGRFNVLVQGVCRARLNEIQPPVDDRLYLQAVLEPAEMPPPDDLELKPAREWVVEELESGSLSQLRMAEDLLEYVQNAEIPTSTVLEIVSFTLVQDTEARYALLDEPDVTRRADRLRNELGGLAKLIRLAERQGAEEWPKGLSWN